MAKKKSAAPEPAEPEANEGPHGKAISKAEAIRQVMADGIDNPSLGSTEIKRRFGIELTPQHFSAAKAQMKNRSGAPKGKRGRKPKAVVDGYLAPPPKVVPTGDGDLLEALKSLKGLVSTHGVDKVHELVDLLG